MTEIRGGVEVRLDENGCLDEVVASEPLGRFTFHLERMDDGHVWFRVTVGGASCHVMLIASPDGDGPTIRTTHEWEDEVKS